MPYAKPKLHSDKLSSKLHNLETSLLNAGMFGTKDLEEVIELRQEAERLEDWEEDTAGLLAVKDKLFKTEEERDELLVEIKELQEYADDKESHVAKAEEEQSRLEGIVEQVEGSLQTLEREYSDLCILVNRALDAEEDAEGHLEALTRHMEKISNV